MRRRAKTVIRTCALCQIVGVFALFASLSAGAAGPNMPPTITAGAGSPTYTENGPPVSLYNHATVSTIEVGQTIMQIVFTVSGISDGSSEIVSVNGTDVALTNGISGTTPANGMNFSVSVAGGAATLTVSSGSGMSTSMTAALVNGMRYRNASDNPTASQRTVVIASLQDSGGTAGGGSDTSQPMISALVMIAAVNDPPVNTVPAIQHIRPNRMRVFSATSHNTISVSDVDAGSNPLQVTLTAIHGLLTLATTNGLTFTAGTGTGDVSMTFTGAQTGINAALNGMGFAPDTGYLGSASLQIVTNDQGYSGSGGALSDTDTITISVETPYRCYVNASATSPGDGLTWATAYTDLQSALNNTACAAVWVAKGIYKPTAGTDQTISFNVLPEMRVYGGFAGTETALAQRVPGNLSVLSGDIDNNDTGMNGVDADTTHIVGKNTRSVVLIDCSRMAGQISPVTTLDGFTITGGDGFGGGGGLYWNAQLPNPNFNSLYGCSPTFTNLVFSGNRAGYGSAMYLASSGYGVQDAQLSYITFSGNSGSGGHTSALYIEGVNLIGMMLNHVTFIGNSNGAMSSFCRNTSESSGFRLNLSARLTHVVFSDNVGGAMYNQDCNPGLSDVTFSGNSGSLGGAIMNDTLQYGSRPFMTNVTFSDNVALQGGAIYNVCSPGSCGTSVVNGTFHGNTAIGDTNHPACGGAIYSRTGNGGVGTGVGVNATNSILWGDLPSETCATADAGTPSFFSYSVVQGSGGSLDHDPLLGPLQNNGGFTQTMLPGSGSSAIDAAPDCSGSPCSLTDQRGAPRPYGAAYDAGAVEVNDFIFHNDFESTRSTYVSQCMPYDSNQPNQITTFGLEATDWFIEDFDGPTLSANWLQYSNGGTVNIGSGVTLSSTGTQFPYITSTGMPIPPTGNFAVHWQFTDNNLAADGSGPLVLSNGLPANNADDAPGLRAFDLWAGSEVEVEVGGNGRFSLAPYSLVPHDVEYCWYGGKSTFWVDGVNYDSISNSRPNALWFGSPRNRGSSGTPWAGFTLHYVHVLKLL